MNHWTPSHTYRTLLRGPKLSSDMISDVMELRKAELMTPFSWATEDMPAPSVRLFILMKDRLLCMLWGREFEARD